MRYEDREAIVKDLRKITVCIADIMLILYRENEEEVSKKSNAAELWDESEE